MIAGIRGRLLTAAFIRDVFPTLPGAGMPPPGWGRHLADLSKRIESVLGAASSARAVTDIVLLPLLERLGLGVVRRTDDGGLSYLELAADDECRVLGVATAWGEPVERIWRSSIAGAISHDTRWCLCCNGRVLRIVDARRTWTRDYLEFDLPLLGLQAEAQTVLWSVASARAFRGSPAPLDRAVGLSREHGIEVCRALGSGVLEALETLLSALTREGRQPANALWEQSLTVVYRVLFLLFAEARGLVPLWHPVYRDRYSLEGIVTVLLAGRPYRGLWRAVHAISRLAHAGCTAGELRVTAFNGRLFSPSQSATFDSTRLSDQVMSRTIAALTSTASRLGTRTKILYRDLDVEQLGAVYERVLEYEPVPGGPMRLARTRDVRKSSASFYTPRALTTFLVRRTLEPLVRGRAADDILKLRVLDPAMGSGAFLVAVCRYLASAVEDALVQEGRWHPHDVTPADRVALRREIASRCLYGVDLNPMAVQLARLSLWLATLASDKPLSFLDHHLVTGHSLVGAAPEDLNRQPGGGTRRRRQAPLTLFEETGLSSALAHAAEVISRVSTEPDDSAAIVHAKERSLQVLHSEDSSITRWRAALDLWCGAWFRGHEPAPERAVFHDLVATLLGRPSTLAPHISGPLLEQSATIAARHRFLHWPLAFPDVFAAAMPSGFDAVVGNPPWDMVRGDSGGEGARGDRRLEARQVTDFLRESGIYRVESRAHVNLYQLFVERALQLVRSGGRVGLVVPSGLVSDAGTAPLRRHLFHHADVDEVTGFDNRLAIFPVHRSVRFVLITSTAGRHTSEIRCRFGLSSTDELEGPARSPLILSRRLLTKLSGDDDLGLPELTTETDLAIVEAVSDSTTRLGAKGGWHAAFGRELNASDDRELFVPIGAEPGRPVIEGKQIDPFRVDVSRSRLSVRTSADRSLQVPRRARLAYRDVASATNRLTLIAAIVPASAVTTHTLFCLRTPLPLPAQRVLCALLNSYVANYLIRLRVNTHVTVSLISRLPVPVVPSSHPFFARLAACSEALSVGSAPAEGREEYTEIQALSAHLYRLNRDQFEHVLGTFPLVPREIRDRAFRRFIDLR